jgi:hypothetical protein
VTDQHDPGSVMDMQVIGNIDQQFFQALRLNPGVEDRGEIRKLDRLSVLNKKFDIDVLYVHDLLL